MGVAPRTHRRGDKHAIAHSRFLWVDVDEPGELPALWALLAERPCHLLIESGGSGDALAIGSSPSRWRRHSSSRRPVK